MDEFEHSKPLSKWRLFELYAGDMVRLAVDPRVWRLTLQRGQRYSHGGTLKMDAHLAERRPGGIGVVIDFKHFPIAALNRHEVDSVINYKKNARASKVILMISESSKILPSFEDYAASSDVYVLRVSPSRQREAAGQIRSLLDSWVSPQTLAAAAEKTLECAICQAELAPDGFGADSPSLPGRVVAWLSGADVTTDWELYFRGSDEVTMQLELDPLCGRCARKHAQESPGSIEF